MVETNLPFKEYSSTLSRYSDNNQLQANQYKSILESELGQAYYQREFKTIGEAALGPLNANVPRYNTTSNIKVEDKNVNVFKEFWQYKQPGATIFTDWNSAGISAIKEDLSIKDLPLYGQTIDPTLVLSNTNNVRNNLINYGKEYLTTTNMLNSEAFLNGISYETGGTSPFRTGTKFEMEQIEHGNFQNKEDGDYLARQMEQLRVDLPINYANTSISSWNYINPAFFIPNVNKDAMGNIKIHIFHEQLKFGIFDLDSLKLVGMSCLTENFGIIPQGYDRPVSVLNDDNNFAPLNNIDYYKLGKNYFNRKDGPGSNLFCSANTNFVTMPKNYLPKLDGLDTSFVVSPGNDSITLGTIMSSKLKDFINNDLFSFNRNLVVMQIYSQELKKLPSGIYWKEFKKSQKTNLMNKIESNYPHLFLDYSLNEMNMNFEKYMDLPEGEKYKYIFNMQRNFASINQGHPELEIFINHLSIFKFGGNNINYPDEFGKVRLKELSENDIKILSPGCFTLVPTMLSEDVFSVRQELPKQFTGNIGDINQRIRKMSNNTPIKHHGNNCITDGANYETNATNCAFRGKANMWQQRPVAGEDQPNFVPNMFNDPNNLNNDIYNLDNPLSGLNKYNAPTTF